MSTDDALPPEEFAALQEIAAERGLAEIPNVFRALASDLGLMTDVSALGRRLRFESSLDPELREAVILTVARERACQYEWSHHWAVVEELGIADGVERVLSATARAPGSAAERSVRVTSTLSRGRPAGSEDVAELKEELGAAAFTEMLVLVGYYGLLAGVLNSLEIPLEDWVTAVPFERGSPRDD